MLKPSRHIFNFLFIFYFLTAAEILAFVDTANRSLRKKNWKLNSTKNKSKLTRRRFKRISEWRQASVILIDTLLG